MPKGKQSFTRGLVVKVLHEGNKTYAVVADATAKLVDIRYVAYNTDMGMPTIHATELPVADVRIPITQGFQDSPVATLIRQLTGIYKNQPQPIKASALIEDKDQPDTDPEIADAQAGHP